MKIKDIEVGRIFNIESTPSYPKLKTEQGYIDIRDIIVNNSGNCDNRDGEIMPLELLAKNYEGTIEEIKEWIMKQTGITPR